MKWTNLNTVAENHWRVFSSNNVIIFNGRENKFEANQVPKLEKAVYSWAVENYSELHICGIIHRRQLREHSTAL